MSPINSLNKTFFSREFIAVDQRQDGTLDLHVRTLNILQQALRYLFGVYSNTIWNHQKATKLVGGLADQKEWKHLEKAITDPDLFEKVFKVAKKVIIPKDDMTRNVLVVGRSRSGKSTMINMLKDVCQVEKGMSLFFQTRNPTKEKVNIGDYNFKFLDTPGLAEHVQIGQVARTNDQIIALIKKEVRNIFGGKNFEHVDTVIFTFTVSQGLRNDEIDCLQEFLPKLSPNTKKLIVVTNQQGALETVRQDVIDQLNENPAMSDVMRDHFENGNNLLFSGCVEKFAIEYGSKETVKRQAYNVYNQSKALVEALLPDTLTDEEKKKFHLERSRTLTPKVNAFINDPKAAIVADDEEGSVEELEEAAE